MDTPAELMNERDAWKTRALSAEYALAEYVRRDNWRAENVPGPYGLEHQCVWIGYGEGWAEAGAALELIVLIGGE